MKRFWLAVLALLFHAFAQAGIIQVDFTATNFVPAGAPVAQVTGSFTYLETMGGAELLSQDFTIAGHRYTSDEVGIFSFAGGFYLGATPLGFDGIVTRANDFRLLWDTSSKKLESFLYSVPDPVFPDMLWSARTISYSVQNVPVPEPASLVLSAVGLIGLAFAVRLPQRLNA